MHKLTQTVVASLALFTLSDGPAEKAAQPPATASSPARPGSAKPATAARPAPAKAEPAKAEPAKAAPATTTPPAAAKPCEPVKPCTID